MNVSFYGHVRQYHNIKSAATTTAASFTSDALPGAGVLLFMPASAKEYAVD